MTTWQNGFVQANGIRLHYTRTGGGGDRRPIVLAHGITDNGRCYTHLANLLQTYYDCIMVDARGHGKSDKPETGYSPHDHAADLAGVIEALGLERPVVMGHSMGGVTATVLAAEYPELISAAILEDPAWEWPDQPGVNEATRRERYETWRRNHEARLTEDVSTIIFKGRLEHPNWASEEFDDWAQAKLETAPQALEYVLYPRTAWQEWVARFKNPALVLYGDQELGGIVGPDMAAAARQANPLMLLRNLPGAGHNVRRERFDAFAWAVREFLAVVLRHEAAVV